MLANHTGVIYTAIRRDRRNVRCRIPSPTPTRFTQVGVLHVRGSS